MALVAGAALVTVAVVLFLLQPVTRGLHASLDRTEDELTETEARKRVALLALRDVEYDFLSGKLDEKDYRNLKGELTAEALAALEADEKARDGTASREELEAEIARVRTDLRGGPTCAECGFTNEPRSRFCSSCGTPLHVAATG